MALLQGGLAFAVMLGTIVAAAGLGTAIDAAVTRLVAHASDLEAIDEA